MVVHNTNSKIRETLSRLRKNFPAFINSNENLYVKETDHIEINALFGLMYLRALLDLKLQRVDYLFAGEGHYAFGAIMSQNRFKFLLSHNTFDNHIDRENNWPKIVLPQCDQYESCSVQTLGNMLHQINT